MLGSLASPANKALHQPSRPGRPARLRAKSGSQMLGSHASPANQGPKLSSKTNGFTCSHGVKPVSFEVKRHVLLQP
jgi:hypothetical protein